MELPMSSRAIFHKYGLWLVCFAVLTSGSGAVHDEERTGSDNYTVIDTIIGDVPLVLVFTPPSAERIVQETTRQVFVNYSTQPPDVDVLLRVRSQDPDIAQVVGDGVLLLPARDNGEQPGDVNKNASSFAVSFTIKGIFLGRTRLIFDTRLGNVSKDAGVITKAGGKHKSYSFADDNDGDDQGEDWTASRFEEWERLPVSYRVSVMRPQRLVDKLFMGIVFLLVICANIGMGCKLDLDVVKEVLKRPFAPAIGFCSQFIFMPLLAFGIAKLIGLTGGQALGFFAMGCAPGGGASNLYTYLLNGDVSLSVTMTLISVVASLGMIPLWLFTLGQSFLDQEANIRIPFENILGTLTLIIVPVGIGILIQKKLPKWAKIISRFLKPVFAIFIIFLFTFGVWANLYVFKLFTPKLILCGCLLPYSGFILGGSAALICRQKLPRVIAICVETGIQNTGVPILMLKYSLPPPEGDLSIVSPIVTSTFTPLPLWIAIAALEIRRRCCSTKQPLKDDVDTEKQNEFGDKEMTDMNEREREKMITKK